MITNPSQRQLDLRHKKDLVIEVQKSFTIRILEKIFDMILGNKTEYVVYNNKKYRPNELIIYTKEEVASMRTEDIKALVGPNSSKYKVNTNVTLQGNINRIAIIANGNVVRVDYNDLQMFLKQIENAYKAAIDNNNQFNYESVEIRRLTSFTYGTDFYEFVNNFLLEINIMKNIDTKKYTAMETAFQIELSKECDTVQEAINAIKDVIAVRLELIRENKKSSDLLFKYKKLKIDTDKIERTPISKEAIKAIEDGTGDLYSNICIKCGKCYIDKGKRTGECPNCRSEN